MSNYPPPGQQYGGAPPSYGPPGATGFNAGVPPATAPPPGNFGPPGTMPPGYGVNPAGTAPPMSGPPANSFGAPGNLAPAPMAAPKSSVQFFSTAGGTPVPATTNNAPPSSGPPSMGGPPIGGPPTGGPSGGMGAGNMPPPGGPPSGGPPGSAAYGAPLAGGVMPPNAPPNAPPGGMMMMNQPSGPPTGGAPMPGGVQLTPPGSMGPGASNQAAAGYTGVPAGFGSGGNLAGMGGAPGHGGPAVPGAPAMMGNPNMPGQQPIPGTQPLGGAPGGAGATAPGPGGAPANAATAGAPLPSIDEMDLSIQCNPNFMRATVSKIVASQGAANSSRVPIGLVCKPMWGDIGTDNDEIEVVDFGATGIVRCKRCRTYINPFVTWADNGRRWRCNICGMLNDVPSTYFSHLDNNGQRRDKDQRPELSRCSVEFVAPSDYMVRPPQPPVYFFVIDVSEAAVASGMIQNTVNAIKASLDSLPEVSRAQIGFITFDSHIHFYNLKSSLAAPQMLVVSDVSDLIMPLPDDLLVNLQESRGIVESLLDSLPSMFQTASSANTCTGPALLAAKRVIQHLGGKLMLFQSSLPTIGEGALKLRENPRLLGSDKEHTMLNAEESWYKTNAIDFSRLQVSVDVFLFSGQYTDLATLSVLAKYTAGSTYYYPGYHAPRDGAKYEHDLSHNLTRATAFEAVMRVRATRGLRFSNFYGSYFVRGTDLLALPTCTSDSSFSLDIAYDEAHLAAQAITIQAALLYTSTAGERRIRVHTMVIPVTQSVSEMVESLDIDCAMNLLSKQAVDIAQKTGMENARQRVNQTTVDMMRASKSGGPGGGPAMGGQYGMPQQQPQAAGATTIPSSLLLLPLYAMSLQKSPVIRGGTDVRIDERAYFQQLLNNMDIEETKVFIYPRLFSIHDMGNDIGLPCDNADDEFPTAGPMQVRLPSILNLSYERLSSNGIFLLENGQDLFLWIGRAVNPAIISTLFGLKTLEGADMSTLQITPESSDFSSRVDAVVRALREDRARYMQLHFIREGDGYAEAYFARYLIEDRANFSGGGLSYTEYHALVTRAMSGLPG